MLYFGGVFCLFNLFLFSLVMTKSSYEDSSEAIAMTIVNLSWNLYDSLIVISVIRATTRASGEGNKSLLKPIYKIVNASMDRKFNGRVWKILFRATIQWNFFHFEFFTFPADEPFRADYVNLFGFFLRTFQLRLVAVLQGWCSLLHELQLWQFSCKFQFISASVMYLVILFQFESATPSINWINLLNTENVIEFSVIPDIMIPVTQQIKKKVTWNAAFSPWPHTCKQKYFFNCKFFNGSF